MEFKTFELHEIFDSVSIKHSFSKEKLVFLNTSDILDGDFLHDEYSDVKDFPGQAKKSIEYGDILYSEIRPANKRFALVDFDSKDYVVSTKLMVLRIKESMKEQINLLFIYKLITSNKFIEGLQKIAESRSGTFPQITFKEFGRIQVNIPNLEYQMKVARLISLIDDKKSLNKNLVIEMEQISQTLFKHWFIDFEFPNQQGQPYKSSGGEMVESELGEIPRDFTLRLLNDICEVKDGTHDSPKQVENGYPLVTSKHLKTNEIDFSTTKLISEDDFMKVNKRSLVEYKDILISMIGTVGRLYFVQEHNINYAIKNIGLIKSSQTEVAEFIYMYFKSPFMINYIKERMTGSTQQYISLTELRKIPVIYPNKEVIELYLEKCKVNFDMIYNLTKENQSLSQLRDALLPKLLSGEIEIPDELEV